MTDEKQVDVKVVDRRWWARGDTATPDEAPARRPTAIEDLEQQLADTTARLQAVLMDQRRSQQEFEELRARLRREAAREADRARRTLLADLLEVGDNLDRALLAAQTGSAAPPPDAAANLARGIGLVRDQFLAKLEQFGVSRFASMGEPFDATKHEAISTAPASDRTQDGVVVTVVKEGYLIGNDLLRPASVIVGKADD